jgi:hypothetical protein
MQRTPLRGAADLWRSASRFGLIVRSCSGVSDRSALVTLPEIGWIVRIPELHVPEVDLRRLDL